MIRQQIIAAADGTSLYYEISGTENTSLPIAVLCDGIGCDGFIWRYLKPWLERRCQVLHPHYRGHGCSGRSITQHGYRIEMLAQDIETVLEYEQFDEVVLIGHSMGVQVALEAAASWPSERILGLILMCGSFGRPLDTFRDVSAGSKWLPLFRVIVERYGLRLAPFIQRLTSSRLGWWVALATEVDGTRLSRDEFAPYLKHLAAMDPNVFLEMLTSTSLHTVEDRLVDINIPAFVVGGEFDRFTPYWVSQVMAQRLPSAELLCLHGGTHAAPLEQPHRLETALSSFCEQHAFWSEGQGAPLATENSNFA